MDSEYYINASRERSISNNDQNNNSWTYKLNEGLKIPAGSTIQVTNSFINKQGVTNESIEINEDINETFQVGFTVPQTAMYIVKPERTPKDDRLVSATLEDPEGSLGLQTPEISTVLTNYYDACVQHNLVYSGGLNLFSSPFDVLNIYESGSGIGIEVGGDLTQYLKTGMPCVLRGLVVQNNTQTAELDGRTNPVSGYYMKITSSIFYGTNTLVTTATGNDQFISSPGFTNANYSSIDVNALTKPTINVPSVDDKVYSSLYGVAMINSLLGTKEDGGTMYQQSKLSKTEFAWENPDPVPMLDGQIDNINYQGGIDSQVIAEEFRKQTADPSRDSVFNAKQTSEESYNFSRGSYSFLLGPTITNFNITNNEMRFEPLVNNFNLDPQLSYGLNGHTIRMNANNMMIGKTGETPRMNWLDGSTDYKFFPYLDAPPHTEYPNKKYHAIPRAAQPAKYKDTYSSQVDYLRNGFSYDCATSRVELFTADETSMINYEGAQNPMQPNIYQNRLGQDITENNLSTLPQATYLDRIILSQTMISGLMNRYDSKPYVSRTYSFDVMNIPSEFANLFKVGKIITGIVDITDASAEIQERLLPHREFRCEIDPEAESGNTNQEFTSNSIEVKFMIKQMTGEGTANVAITDVEALTNLEINGLTFINWNVTTDLSLSTYQGTDASDETFMKSQQNYGTEIIGQTTLTISITSETFEDQNPQYVPIFSAKGTFSDLKGNTSAGLRTNEQSQKRIFVQQRGMASAQGIHPRRTFVNPTGDGLTSFKNNMLNIPVANYLFGSTSHCSLGSMRPPVDKSFSEGQVAMKVPLVGDDEVPTPANNGLTSLSSDLESFDPDASNNILKLKLNEERTTRTIIEPVPPLDGSFPAVVQKDPFGKKTNTCKANCASALGDYEGYPYSTPTTDMMDTGGTGDNLCLVQIQSLVDDLGYNYGDYVLRPLTSDIQIEIPKGVYSINSFINTFNDQIKDLDKNSEQEMASIDNYKTVRKFKPLGGNALTGGQVTLLNDFLPSTHSRTVFSEDIESEFITNPLVIAVSVQTYNDIVRAWQYCGGDADLVSYYMALEDNFENCYYNTQAAKTVGGGSYTWKNFRDKYYWCEFVDKYSDNIQDLINETEEDDVENYDLQYYFAKFRNGSDATGIGNYYGCRTLLGYGDTGVPSVEFPSSNSQYIIDENTVPQIDKVQKYNSAKKGIYIGSPNFELTYDQDRKTFALDGLHYAFRNPTTDLTGESTFDPSSVGQPTILFRNLSELIQGDYEVDGVDANLPSYIKNALEQPIDQISGVFIFNMAKTTSSSLGTFINKDSSNIGRVFSDYFVSEEKAREGWLTTFWSRLGFDYETFNTRTSNDLSSYYLNPVDNINVAQLNNFVDDQVSYLKTQTVKSSVSVKYRPRQVLITDVVTNANFNDIGRDVEDNYLPGVKTSSNFDIRSIPSIASLPGVLEGAQKENVRLFNNASISTVRSMSGGYIYYPMKLGAPNSFDITTNYTAQNISAPGEGYIYQAPLQGNTIITNKGGAVVPPASQLLYQYAWQYLPAAVPGYVPISFYSKTYSQPVNGQVNPVAFDYLNVAWQVQSPFRFSHRSQFNITNGVYRDRTFSLNGSMFLASQSTPITSSSNSIEAFKMPILTEQGHFIITSDLVKRKDSINGSDQIPILGIIPISSLSSQDFITSFNDISHVIEQDTVINSIKIQILNPDLTAPFLEKNSTVIIKVIFPQPQGIPPQLQNPTKLQKKEEKEQLVGV